MQVDHSLSKLFNSACRKLLLDRKQLILFLRVFNNTPNAGVDQNVDRLFMAASRNSIRADGRPVHIPNPGRMLDTEQVVPEYRGSVKGRKCIVENARRSVMTCGRVCGD